METTQGGRKDRGTYHLDSPPALILDVLDIDALGVGFGTREELAVRRLELWEKRLHTAQHWNGEGLDGLGTVDEGGTREMGGCVGRRDVRGRRGCAFTGGRGSNWGEEVTGA